MKLNKEFLFDTSLTDLFKQKKVINIPFLKDAYNQREKLKNYILKYTSKTIPLSELTPADSLENFVVIDNNALFLTVETWNIIFDSFIKNAHQKSASDLAFNIKNLYIEFGKQLNSKNKHLYCLQSMKFTAEEFSLGLSTLINYRILAASRKDKYKYAFEPLSFSYTSFSSSIGKGILQLYLNKYSKLANIIYSYKVGGTIDIDTLIALKTLILAIISKDLIQCKDIYDNIFKIKNLNEDLLLGLNNLVFDFALDRFLASQSDFFVISEILNDIFYSREAKTGDLSNLLIGLGTQVIDGLVDLGLFIKKRPFDKLGKPQWRIFFMQKLSIELLQKESMHRPPLINENIAFLNKGVTSNSIFTFYVNNINKYIHSNDDLYTIIPENSFLNKEPLFTKFAVDRQHLLFFLKKMLTFINVKYNNLEAHYEDVLVFLNALYDTDFKRMLKKNQYTSDMSHVKDLIDYALNFNVIVDDTLYKQLSTIKEKPRSKFYTNIYLKLINYKIFF